MANRSIYAWSIVGALILSGCQGEDQRETIRTRGTRGKAIKNACQITTPGSVNKATNPVDPAQNQQKNQTQKPGKTAQPPHTVDQCLDLARLVNCMKGSDNEVARLITKEVRLFEPMTSSQKREDMTPIKDQKVLAQLLNLGGDLKLEARLGVRLKEVREAVEILNNVATQTGCEKVALANSNGTTLTEYKINSKSAAHLDMQVPGKNEWLIIRASSPQRVMIQRVRPLTRTKICDKNREFMVSEAVEVSFGHEASSGFQISKPVARIIEAHTDASDTLKMALKSQDSAEARAQAKGRRGQRGAGSIGLDTNAILDAYSRVRPGQLKNIECGGTNGSAPTARF